MRMKMDKSHKTTGELGTVAGLVEVRPVVKSQKRDDLIPGDTEQYLDVLLCNSKGREKLVRFPVSPEVVAFYQE